MKMTEFEVGKKYYLPEWNPGEYLICYEDRLSFPDGASVFIGYERLTRNDWKEYKEPVDYGTDENRKLFLVQSSCGKSRTYREGYDDSEDYVLCIDAMECEYLVHKSRVLKVLDLPSKEL